MSQDYILRYYQEDISSEVYSLNSSVLIELPTGGGKTVIAKQISIDEINNGGTVLLAAPKVKIMEQMAKTFASLSPQVIHGNRTHDNEHNVFISTIQTIYNRELDFEPSMIILDEIHFGFNGKMIKKLLDGYDGKVVGLSATPYDNEGRKLEGFEHIINKYDIRYLIENEYLVPVKCFAPVKVDLSDIKTIGGDYSEKELERKFNTMESIGAIVEATKKTIKRRKKTMVFCVTIKHSEAMARAYRSAGIPAKALHSNLTEEEQNNILKEFEEGKIHALTNPSSLATGYDHPPVATIVLARATKSQNLYRQMVGRGMRPHRRKKECILLDCAGVIDELGMPTEPIREIEKNQKEAVLHREPPKCAACRSEKVHKELRGGSIVRVCGYCSHVEELYNVKGYECGSCNAVFGHDALFVAKEGKLYLECTECGELTPISDDEGMELEAVFDPSYVNEAVSKIMGKYSEWILKEFGIDFYLTNKVKRHYRAVDFLARQHPERISRLKIEAMEKHDEWRLFKKDIEDKIIDFIEAKRFEKGYRFEQLALRANKMLEKRKMKMIPACSIEKIKNAIRNHSDEYLEEKINAKLVEVYKNDEDCSNIEALLKIK